MKKVLSIKEIKVHYKQEWILIGSPVYSKLNEIIEGRIIAHSKNRDEIYRKAKSVEEKTIAIFYNGKLPQDAAVIL